MREAVHVDDLEESSLGTVQYLISQELKDTYQCPCCYRPAKAISYHVRILNHITDKGHECQLVVNIPKLRCDGCKGTPRVRFPAADGRKGYTRQLKRAVITALKTKSRTSAAKEFNLHWETVENILADTIGEAISEQDLSHVTGVFVDETQFGHGQDYITTFLDQKHRVIFMCKGHGSEVLSLFRDHLIIQGGDPNRSGSSVPI